MPRPFRAAGGEGFLPGLLCVGLAQYLEQMVDHGRVALFGLIDGLLRKIVTQHINGIGGVHPSDPFFRGFVVSKHTPRPAF